MHTHSASNFLSPQACSKKYSDISSAPLHFEPWPTIVADPLSNFQLLQAFPASMNSYCSQSWLSTFYHTFGTCSSMEASNTKATQDNLEQRIGCRNHGGGSGHWTPWIHLHYPWAQISNCPFGFPLFQSLWRLQMAACNPKYLQQ